MTARTGRPEGNKWLIPDDGIVDEVAVGIAARGERLVALTKPERLAAAGRILAAGETVKTVAVRLGISERTAAALTVPIRPPGAGSEAGEAA